MIIFTVEDEFFQTEPLFVVGCSIDQLKAYLLKQFKIRLVDVPESCSGTMFTFEITPWRLVWCKRERDLPVLAHEIFHLTTRICQDRGVPIVSRWPTGELGDETAAYLFKFLLAGALKGIRDGRRIRTVALKGKRRHGQ